MQAFMVRSICELLEAQESLVLLTIVAAWGTTSRGVGTQMLVCAEGAPVGTVGGGALESVALALAQQALVRRESCVVSLVKHLPDLSAELLEAAKENPKSARYSHGITVLLQYLTPQRDYSYWRQVWEVIARQRQAVKLCLRLNEYPEQVFLLEKDSVLSTVQKKELQAATSSVLELEASPASILVVLGAGHVARALALVAKLCDYEVRVIDDRPELVKPRFFPSGCKLYCQAFTEYLTQTPLDQYTSVVLVPRDHALSQEALRQMAGLPLAYVGMLGSSRGSQAMLKRLAALGVDREWLSRVHTPVGLPIGAHTPQEIAVSIVGEMIATRNLPPIKNK